MPYLQKTLHKGQSMKFITLKDIHFRFGFKAPAGRTQDFEAQILDKVKQVIDIAKEHKIQTLILTGDSTDIKSPSSYTLPQIQANISVFRLLREQFTNIYDICGNHSLPYSSIDYKQDSFYQLLCDSSLIVDLNRGIDKEDAYIIGIDYTPSQAQLFETIQNIDKRLSDKKANILVIHEHLIPKGDTLSFGSFITYENVTKDLKHIDYIIAGHLHKGYPTQTIKNNLGREITIINQWNFTRLARDYYVLNQSHIPQLTIIDTQSKTHQTIDLQCASYDDAFIQKDLQSAQNLQSNLAKFVYKAKQVAIANSELSIDTIPTEIKSKVEYYLELAKSQ